MPTYTQVQKPRPAAAGPFVLRLAVGGILAMAAIGNMARSDRPVDVETVPSLEAPASVADPLDTAGPFEPVGNPQSLGHIPTDATIEMDGSTGVIHPSTPEVVTETPVSLYPSQIYIIVAEIGAALFLIFGLLTRLVSFAGAAGIAVSALIAHGMMVAPTCCNSIFTKTANMYENNPNGWLLLGAIFLSLLVSGAGVMSLDRLIFTRRRTVQTVEEPTR